MRTILTGAKVEVNEVDLSNQVSSITIDKQADDHDTTPVSAEHSHEHTLGLSEDSITLNFFQDFEAASVDATLSPLQGSNDGFPIVITEKSGKTWTMTAKLPNYQPLAGASGEVLATECQFLNGGDGIAEGTASGSGS